MLAADKQLLDAHLRNELQQLRRLEITNVVNRFQNALTPATLIAGFSFTGIVDLEFADGHEGRSFLAKHAEPVFYMAASAALSLSLYVTAVSSMGIVFGQRLTIQATASQGSEHEATVRELNQKFLLVLIALGLSMAGVVVGERARVTPPLFTTDFYHSPCPFLRVCRPSPPAPPRASFHMYSRAAATAVVWLKDPDDNRNKPRAGWVSIATTAVVACMGIGTILSMIQMFCRLHTPTPEASSLNLRTGKDKMVADVPEFFVAGEPPQGFAAPSGGGMQSAAHQRKSAGPPPDERSNLLCLERPGK